MGEDADVIRLDNSRGRRFGMSRLQGRIALVTGAASGIGLATTRRFAAEGATVIMVDRDRDRLTEAHASLGNDRHETAVLDVTNEEAWIALARRVIERHGHLDILFNNAGYGAFKSLADTTSDYWRSLIAVNLDSVFLATKYLLPSLAASGGASIVNMSSIRGLVGGANSAAYSAAKGGVRLFTKATAIEFAQLGNGVRVNSIHPGHIETPLTAGAHADPAIAEVLLADVPLGRIGVAEEIADAVLFLASDDSRYMTGSELVVDGGSTAH
jgi:meso-butanediol dehydrogenase / (S,S)-butanediol dehydrogenase / diacetyl reductase